MLLVCLIAIAVADKAQAEVKIGIFRMPAVIVGSEYGKAMNEQLKAKFEPLAKDLQREGEEVKKIESELRNQDLALKLEAKQDKQREYRRKARDYQDSIVAYRQKRQADEQKLGQPILQRVAVVLSEYGKANGFTIIFEVSQSGVAYASEAIDITQDIIAELNKMKKAGK